MLGKVWYTVGIHWEGMILRQHKAWECLHKSFLCSYILQCNTSLVCEIKHARHIRWHYEKAVLIVLVSHMALHYREQCSRSPTWFDKVLAENSLHEHDLFKLYTLYHRPKRVFLLLPKLQPTVPSKSPGGDPIDTPCYHIEARLASSQRKTMAQHSEQLSWNVHIAKWGSYANPYANVGWGIKHFRRAASTFKNYRAQNWQAGSFGKAWKAFATSPYVSGLHSCAE